MKIRDGRNNILTSGPTPFLCFYDASARFMATLTRSEGSETTNDDNGESKGTATNK